MRGAVEPRNVVLDVPERLPNAVWMMDDAVMEEPSRSVSRSAASRISVPVTPVARRMSFSDREMRLAGVYANVRRAFMMSVELRRNSGLRISQELADFEERSREWGRQRERHLINHDILEVREDHFRRPVEPPATQGPRPRLTLPRETQDSSAPRRLYYFGA